MTAISHCRFFGNEPPYGDQSVVALVVIQWLESLRQRKDLKLVLNRRMRSRMYGGVGGVRREPAPIPIGLFPAVAVANLRPIERHESEAEMRRSQQCPVKRPKRPVISCQLWIAKARAASSSRGAIRENRRNRQGLGPFHSGLGQM
jgi:hypothetical protein